MRDMFLGCLHIITFSQFYKQQFLLINKSVPWHSGEFTRFESHGCSFVVCECLIVCCYDHDIGTRLVPISWSTPSLVTGCGIGVNPIPSHWIWQRPRYWNKPCSNIGVNSIPSRGVPIRMTYRLQDYMQSLNDHRFEVYLWSPNSAMKGRSNEPLTTTRPQHRGGRRRKRWNKSREANVLRALTGGKYKRWLWHSMNRSMNRTTAGRGCQMWLLRCQ